MMVAGCSEVEIPARRRCQRVGVVDIGSNSVRLVSYDGTGRSPAQTFNEKALCGLGRGLASTGKLDPEGVVQALRTLERFAVLANIMELERLDAVATAAVRDASDGMGFVARASDALGRPIRILSGQEEAYYSAEGVLSAIPNALGLAGDLGGGSLELVALGDGQVGQQATLPLGPQRLAELAQGNREKATAMIDAALATLPWVDEARNQTFYAVGGAWRALGRLHMVQTSYPLRVLHHYSIERGAARDLSRVAATMSRESLERISGLPRRRLDSLPLAALVLDRVIKVARPKEIVFSSHGLREGLLFSRLNPAERALDPLIEATRNRGQQYDRYTEHGDELAAWMAVLFGDEGGEEHRLRRAACHLSDIGWRNHPDYRAQQSLFEILRGPFVGLDHQARAVLALAVYARYDGDFDAGTARQASSVLSLEQVDQARLTGALLRLGHSLTAGVDGVLRTTSLNRDETTLTLTLPSRYRDLAGEAVDRRLASVGRLIGLRTRVVVSE